MVGRLESDSDKEEGKGDLMEEEDRPAFQHLIQEALHYITEVASIYGNQAHKTTNKFWKALLGKAYDIIDKVSN